MKYQGIERGRQVVGHRVSRAGLPGRLTHRVAAIVLVTVTSVGLIRPAIGDEVALRSSVRLPGGATVVHLADIATLAGPHAERCADTIVGQVGDPTQVLEISIGQVRQALTEAGVHWGKVQLSGRKVIVRPQGPTNTSPPLAMAPASITKSSGQRVPQRSVVTEEPAQDLIELPTLRGAVARLIAQGLHTDPSDLRLIFDDDDAAFLSTREEVFRFEIQPLGSLGSNRIELSVRAWSADRVRQTQSLTVRPMIRTHVVLPRYDIDRGVQLSAEDLSVEDRWLPPSQSNAMSTLVQAVGRVTTTRLRAGRMLRAKDVKREVLIERGDRVMVRCLVGGVVISLEAEARSGGAENDLIELRKLGERDTFFGIVTGPGAAIVDLNR